MAVCQLVVEASNGGLVVLAQPTNDLIEQTGNITLNDLASKHRTPDLTKLIERYGNCRVIDLPFVKIINSNQKEGGSVQKSILDRLKRCPGGHGSLLIITHSALFSLPFGHPAWRLVIDETHSCFNYFNLQAKKTGQFILKNVEVVDDPSMPEYLRLRANGATGRRNLATIFEEDDALKVFQQLVREIISPSFRCYIERNVWANLQNGKTCRLIVHSILTPTIVRQFSDVTIMSARFNETLLYQVWSGDHFKVRFERDSQISPLLSGDRKHVTREPVTIVHALPGDRYSRTLYNNKDSVGRSLHEMLDFAASEYLQGKSCLVTANNSFKDKELELMRRGAKRVSSLSHGIDRFKEIHNYVFLSALNLRNESYTFLKCFGVSPKQVLIGITYHAIYQGACRTSVRLGKESGRIVIIVPTYEMAMWLSTCFEQFIIEKLPGDFTEFLGQWRAPMTSTERSRKKECLAAIKTVLDMNGITDQKDLVEGLVNLETPEAVDQLIKIANERSIVSRYFVGKTIHSIAEYFKCEQFKEPCFFDSYNSESQIISAQFFPSLSSLPIPELSFSGSFDELHSLMKALYKREGLPKRATGALSPAVFGDLKDEKGIRRTKENLKFATLLIIDVDDGKLTPQIIREAFPGTDIITYGTTTPGRFRAVLRLSLVLNESIYKVVWKQVVNRITKVCPHHGIDNCPNPVSLFHLPARGPGTSYPVERQYGEALDVLRLLKGIHLEIIESCIERKIEKSLKPNFQFKEPEQWREEAATKAVAKFEAVPKGHGQRHKAFYDLAVRLAYVFEGDEREVCLRLEQAHYDHIEKPRKIQDCINSLRKSGLVR
ncbi:MAG: hypothetical protein J5J00_15330 [Deltaproteobacteria bacterium]|nr:hypothetical protein [Deltaproteobacteria bacterium]